VEWGAAVSIAYDLSEHRTAAPARGSPRQRGYVDDIAIMRRERDSAARPA
jgi:hypothetical protein